MEKTYARFRPAWIPLALAILLRALGLLPFALDDDEAWFSASGLSLHQPGDFFAKALDNKPPGMTWYYEAVAAIFGTRNLPVAARAISLPLLVLAAWACGSIAARASGDKDSKPLTLLLMILGLSAFHPKVLSVSNEILMIPPICLAYFLAEERRPAWHWLFTGTLLGAAALIKPTALVFSLPLLIATRKPVQWLMAAVGILLALALGAWSVGAKDLMYCFLNRPQNPLLEPQGFCESSCPERSSDYYPQSLGELTALLRIAPKWTSPKNLNTADRLLRIRFALEILRHSCPRLERSDLIRIDELSGTAIRAMKDGGLPGPLRLADWETGIRRFFTEHHFAPPFALETPAWWVSLAVVEMQPVAAPR